ncbi:sugar ABC transporter permease [Phytohabitans sp. ZYX-F-186]|uniref:Sugar ABC transporter permease n=1 Tax=Phytohabitans maris TaxID=3071409 RepID=A0ABU0ZFB3_9ACTN|nr:sugar ABC transporter permease [Phytohabitans sp. ZYX-F-186]MDQ7904642.1 sugar ABC transporter permease [Phytohabitans sp. ZYX-F-186]
MESAVATAARPAGGQQTVERRSPRRRRRHDWWGVAFMLPAAFFLFGSLLIPSVQGAVYAFTDWNGLSADFNWVGLENFRRMVQDDLAKQALFNTVAVTVVLVLLQNAAGLLLAVALNSKIKSRGLMRVVFFSPVVVTPVVVAALWRYMYYPDGPINTILGMVGLKSLQQEWLAEPNLARWAIVAVILWQFSGYLMVIYLAGLQNVPDELIESARLDGAGPVRVFRHITLPMLRPAATIGFLLVAISGLKIFDQVWIITRGGPGTSTHTLSTMLYQEAFVFGKFGYSTAIAVVLTLLALLFAVVQLRIANRRDYRR